MFQVLYGIVALTLALMMFLLVEARRRNMHQWIGGYLFRGPQPRLSAGPIHLFVCVADHFEPAWEKPSYEVECQRVRDWTTRYVDLARRHRDYDGRHPQHSYFYPHEEYRPEHLDSIAEVCRQGFGDVEIHLHHDGDTSAGLRQKLIEFKTILHEQHNLLRRGPTGEVEYAFIHGDWALDNSGKAGRRCGVNDELTILRETGCYADFTLPSAPDFAQTRKINSIYYATDDPGRPKSHNDGVDVRVGGQSTGDLLIIQGPLALNWRSRKWGLVPRIENAEITGHNPPTPDRIDLWIRQHIHVLGRPNWVFIKLHTHGTQELHSGGLLGPPLDAMWRHFESAYNDGERYRLHYVTAREMYELVKCAERGDTDPTLPR